MARHMTPSRRLALLKVHALLDYGFSVCGMAFLSMFMATLGFSIDVFFAVSAIAVVTALVSQNLLSRRSDMKGERLPYWIWSKMLYAASMLLVAHLPSVVTIVASTIMSNLVSGEMIATAVVYELVESRVASLPAGQRPSINKSTEFSKYRIFGSMGWAFTAPVAGFAIELLNAAGHGPLLGYKISFTLSAAGVLALGGFLQYILVDYRASDHAASVLTGTGAASKTTFRITLPYAMLLSTSMLCSVALAIQSSALAPYLKGGLGRDEGFFGLMMFTWATSELPLFFLSSHLTRRVGWRPLVVLSYGFLLVKLVVYMIVVSPVLAVMVLLVQVLNPFGISFPAKTYAITNDLAPGGKALGMSLYHTSNALGSFAGGLLGIAMAGLLGAVANSMDGFRVYFGVALLITSAAILLFCILHAVDVSRGKKERAFTR